VAVTPDEVRRLAGLARLSLDPVEVDAMAVQLGHILDRVEGLGDGQDAPDENGVDIPADGHSRAVPLRFDEPGVEPLSPGAEDIAPAWVDRYFTVPRSADGAPRDGA